MNSKITETVRTARVNKQFKIIFSIFIVTVEFVRATRVIKKFIIIYDLILSLVTIEFAFSCNMNLGLLTDRLREELDGNTVVKFSTALG